jgi:hypothetical protein
MNSPRGQFFCAAFHRTEFFANIMSYVGYWIKAPDFRKAIGFFLCRTPFIVRKLYSIFGSESVQYIKEFERGNLRKGNFKTIFFI